MASPRQSLVIAKKKSSVESCPFISVLLMKFVTRERWMLLRKRFVFKELNISRLITPPLFLYTLNMQCIDC